MSAVDPTQVVFDCLSDNPLPRNTKDIANRTGLEKKLINQVLYRNKDKFAHDDSVPPRWVARSAKNGVEEKRMSISDYIELTHQQLEQHPDQHKTCLLELIRQCTLALENL